MKLKDMSAMGADELKKQLEASHKELFDLRFKLASKQLVNHREIPRLKKEIARLNTLITQKQGEATQGKAS
jgi:large subunit ribosomal protein L29